MQQTQQAFSARPEWPAGSVGASVRGISDVPQVSSVCRPALVPSVTFSLEGTILGSVTFYVKEYATLNIHRTRGTIAGAGVRDGTPII
jgi:hypothetical protein